MERFHVAVFRLFLNNAEQPSKDRSYFTPETCFEFNFHLFNISAESFALK